MKYPFLLSLLIYLATSSCSTPSEYQKSVKDTMDEVVSRFYSDFDKSQLDTIGDDFILQYLSVEEKNILASKYWVFEVNVPVTISLMRDSAQEVAPYWLKEQGFEITDLKVTNSHSTYEVWQKDYKTGRIGLGINGFDKHRPVYFLSVGPQQTDAELKIQPIFPAKQHFQTMKTGAFTYHDWDGLVLNEVPEELIGQTLLSTIRGRAREAHLIGAFRSTDSPSSDHPDQILLTWSSDPATTMDIQWRTSAAVENGTVYYWQEGSKDTLSVKAEKFVMEDRLLQNDRFINRFTAQLTKLQPGTSYGYRIGSDDSEVSDSHTFITSRSDPAAFSFLWTGDVHNSEVWGGMMEQALVKHPETAFYAVA